MEDLPLEIYEVISEYLYPKDIMSLKFSSKMIKIRADKNLDRIIKNELSKFTTDPNTLLDIIKKTNVVMSGSFILKCITGEEWESNDIDIYVQTKNYFEDTRSLFDEYIFDFIMNNHNKNCPDKCFHYDEYFHQNMIYQFSVYNDTGYIIRTFNEIKNKNITSIPVSGINILKMIDISFDTDICKNAYISGKLYVKNWLKLIYKQDYIMPCSLMTILIYRNYIVSKENFYQIMMDKLYERQKKYQSRGYKLTLTGKETEYLNKIYNFISYLPHLNLYDINNFFNYCSKINSDPNIYSNNFYLSQYIIQ